ncbi:MAG: hypothetical protein ABIW84_05640 [Ilumatobacteraceae bacterium]
MTSRRTDHCSRRRRAIRRGPTSSRVHLIVTAVILMASFGCSADAATKDGRTHSTPVPVILPIPAGARSVGVASITWSGEAWFAAGSFRDREGEHRPGLWTSTDATTWRRIETAAVTYYGKLSELYSVAGSARGLVAIGTATGGAHGNPRTVSWLLEPDGVLHEVYTDFELYNGMRQISVRSVTEGPKGWVIFGSRVNQNDQIGATSWTSATGDDFTIDDDDPELSSEIGEQKFGLDVTTSNGSLIAVGERTTFASSSIETDGIGWTSVDETTWTPWLPAGLEFGGVGAQRMQRIDANGARIVIAGSETDDDSTAIVAWTSTDDGTWRRGIIDGFGESDDVLSAATSVVATTDEFIVAARVGGVLRLATSADGDEWTTLAISDELPTGNRAQLTAASNGETLLVGATSLEGGGLWRSVTDS